jgi:abortive infection bacteriophage resistance protein
MEQDKSTHVFKPNSKFEDVVSLYKFDKNLRILLFSIIERIEIAFRTKLIYHLSHECGAWWFQNAINFSDSKELVKTLGGLAEELERSKDSFIKDHLKRYKLDLRFPPAWKTLEIASFGCLSKLYGNLLPQIKSKDTIAQSLSTVNHTYLPSWLQTITQIRNICAHHGRLWNKNLPGRPSLLSRPPSKWIADVPNVNEHHMLYIHLCCMKYLLNVINPTNNFTNKIESLFKKYPSVDIKALGFKPNWLQEPLWN